MIKNTLKLFPYASTEDAQKDGAGRVGGGGGGDDAEVSFFNGPIELFDARILGHQL